MKRLLKTIIVTICTVTISANIFAQEDPNLLLDTIDETPRKCLSEYKQQISINLLQFVTGTANVNYEYRFSQMALQVGVGTTIGYRITSDGQNPASLGGLYATIQPRWYINNSFTNCFVQYGIGISYKYWNFEKGTDITSDISDEYKKNPDFYKNSDDYKVVSSDEIYKMEQVEEHLGGISIFGRSCIVNGLTAELELGVGFGTIADDFIVTPNIGCSFGWVFGKTDNK